MTLGAVVPANEPLLSARDVEVVFTTRRRGRARAVRAVRGVSLDIAAGETLALVGESGSGKSTMARAIMRLVPLAGGTIRFDGDDLHRMGRRDLRAKRRHVQMIFQDPYSSLDPSMTVGKSVAEPLMNFSGERGEQLDQHVADVFERVGLRAAHRHRYPHEFSGGQRQRVAIARAIALDPKLIICDEAVSALDVSTQNQILWQLERLRDELGVAYLFVTHDLSVVWHIAHRVAVMYLGEIVEVGTVSEVLLDPAHPYTQSLVSVVPIPNPRLQRQRRTVTVAGELPDPANPPSGCAFHGRCPVAIAECATVPPPWRTAPHGGSARCHLVGSQADDAVGVEVALRRDLPDLPGAGR